MQLTATVSRRSGDRSLQGGSAAWKSIDPETAAVLDGKQSLRGHFKGFQPPLNGREILLVFEIGVNLIPAK